MCIMGRINALDEAILGYPRVNLQAPLHDSPLIDGLKPPEMTRITQGNESKRAQKEPVKL